MKIPNIKIQHNPYLDDIFKVWVLSNPKYKDWVCPTASKVKHKIVAYQKIWNEKGEKILSHICKITELSFKRNHFTVHIVSGNPRSYSDPIVISVSRTNDEFFSTVIHELIHCLFVDNKNSSFVKNTDKFEDHVALYAIIESVMPGIVEEKEKKEI